MSIRHTTARTALGDLLLVAEGDDLTGVYFPGHWYPPSAEAIGNEVTEQDDPVLSVAGRQLREYLAGDRREFDMRVATHGDDFSERVWTLLREIPYGMTTTYGALAETLGNRQLAQRVGQAVGHNPISVVIPCHRVLGADGSLTGFAGGLDRKRALLMLEEPAPLPAGRLF
jgi:methylated-DNA-[protein]-cysteine S-methyltransferase